ncbi:S-layer homology domain-containing protein [Microbacterium protaetiae]|nr:S-layer homology domain-containing protein [Microbacterium protaetiae]
MTVRLYATDDAWSPVKSSSISLRTFKLGGLSEGDYKLLFDSTGQGLVDRWWGGATSFEDADVIHLSAGEAQSVTMSLTKGGSITGQVTLPAGVSPVGGSVFVSLASAASSSTLQSVQVGASGTYILDGLEAGDYRVRSWSNLPVFDQWWKGADTWAHASDVAVTLGSESTSVDFALVRHASMSGKVLFPPGVDLSTGSVTATLWDATDGGTWVTSTAVNPDGSYTFERLRSGKYWLDVYAQDLPLLTARYHGSGVNSDAQTIDLGSGEDKLLQSIQMRGYSGLSGSVLFPLGFSSDQKLTADGEYSSYRVDIYDADTGSYENSSQISATAGAFAFPKLNPGRYKLALRNPLRQDEWFGANGGGQESAHVYVLGDEENVAGIEFVAADMTSLLPGARIEGDVRLGSTIKVVTDSAPSGSRLDYQWFTNGDTPIRGATKPELALTDNLVGQYLSVRITGSIPHFAPVYQPIEVGQVVATFGPHSVSVAGHPVVTGTLSAAVAGAWPTGTDVEYQWLADGSQVPYVSSSDGTTVAPTGQTLKLTDHLVGKRISVTVTGSKPGYGTQSVTSAAVGPVVQAPFVPPAKSPFNDVPTTSRFYREVTWLASSSITMGYPDGTFRPRNAVTREAMAAFLYRFAGYPAYTPPKKSPFSDVPTTAPFYTEVTWLAQTGVTTGYSDGTFRPHNPITREAMAAFLYRSAGKPSFTAAKKSPFEDVATSATFYKEVTWLASTKVTTGYSDGTFRPRNQVTREATAAFLYRTRH